LTFATSILRFFVGCLFTTGFDTSVCVTSVLVTSVCVTSEGWRAVGARLFCGDGELLLGRRDLSCGQ
jgi:hypothetical protein